MEETLEHVNDTPQETPSAIRTLSILTFIGSGLWLFILLISLSMFDTVMDGVMEASEFDASEIDMEALRSIIFGLFVLFAVFCVLCIVGAAMMTKMKRLGFVLYAIGSGLFGLLTILGMDPIGLLTGVISILFIFLYAKHLKSMT